MPDQADGTLGVPYRGANIHEMKLSSQSMHSLSHQSKPDVCFHGMRRELSISDRLCQRAAVIVHLVRCWATSLPHRSCALDREHLVGVQLSMTLPSLSRYDRLSVTLIEHRSNTA